MNDSSSKLAIVTGGSRGIGRAIVTKLVEVGYDVRFTYRASVDEARTLEAQMRDAGHVDRCRGAAVDGTDPVAVAAFVAGIANARPVSLLVNNAGITRDALVGELQPHDLRSVLDSHLGSVAYYTQAVLPGMRRARFGDIVNISSLASRNIRPGNALYGTTKAAVERFSQSVASECARWNIAVNVIAPGFVETELTARMLTADMRRALLERTPLRRFTTVHELADAVLMLIQRKPLLIGAVLPLGGGSHLTA